ncbi:hypothetical protein GCM10009122_49790 [Fulvivirga kasyanovii]|uniref:Glycosyl transferase n=1 Tax=Fulvivirga kasyanovii TaxID=396812 RepID=A0ABW9RIZ6_9BACT|nr:hypothetical protein [Fulvivirga kasyanovii]MTI23666.1 hypothetical protein [Fulvivirga kasyanovii]
MIIFYGFGGGFGHLSRIKTFIDNFGIERPYKVLTNNRSAFQLFEEKHIAFLPADHDFEAGSLRKWLTGVIREYSPGEFYIDTFPCGLLGELSDDLFAGITVNYLCRRLRWHKYQPLISQHPPHIDCAYVFEPLEPEHDNYVKNAVSVKRVEMIFPAPNIKPEALGHLSQPVWLVVHTTHQDEIEVLTDHAIDLAKMEGTQPQVVVLCDQHANVPEGVKLLHGEKPIDWYPHVEKIFTAAGFNTWYQLKPWRNRHVAIPFPRKFDDQFWRAGSK